MWFLNDIDKMKKKLKDFSKGMMKELFVKSDKNFYYRFIEIRDKHFCFSGIFFYFYALLFFINIFHIFAYLMTEFENQTILDRLKYWL